MTVHWRTMILIYQLFKSGKIFGKQAYLPDRKVALCCGLAMPQSPDHNATFKANQPASQVWQRSHASQQRIPTSMHHSKESMMRTGPFIVEEGGVPTAIYIFGHRISIRMGWFKTRRINIRGLGIQRAVISPMAKYTHIKLSKRHLRRLVLKFHHQTSVYAGRKQHLVAQHSPHGQSHVQVVHKPYRLLILPTCLYNLGHCCVRHSSFFSLADLKSP